MVPTQNNSWKNEIIEDQISETWLHYANKLLFSNYIVYACFNNFDFENAYRQGGGQLCIVLLDITRNRLEVRITCLSFYQIV